MFGFDPEVPAGYQDADIEMLELAQAANEVVSDNPCDDYIPASWDDLENPSSACRDCGFSPRSH